VFSGVLCALSVPAAVFCACQAGEAADCGEVWVRRRQLRNVNARSSEVALSRHIQDIRHLGSGPSLGPPRRPRLTHRRNDRNRFPPSPTKGRWWRNSLFPCSHRHNSLFGRIKFAVRAKRFRCSPRQGIYVQRPGTPARIDPTKRPGTPELMKLPDIFAVVREFAIICRAIAAITTPRSQRNAPVTPPRSAERPRRARTGRAACAAPRRARR
jgi:hypothetical protein